MARNCGFGGNFSIIIIIVIILLLFLREEISPQ